MRWGAALEASSIDLFLDIDYIFSHSGWGWEMSLRRPRCILCFLMIIWSPSHVYGLFVTVFVGNLYHCYYGLSSWSPCTWGWWSAEMVSQLRKTYLEVVAVSSPRRRSFCPERQQSRVVVIVFRLNIITLSRAIAVSSFGSKHNTIRYTDTQHIVHILIAGSHCKMCPTSAARGCLVPGELDTSPRKGDVFKPPCRRRLPTRIHPRFYHPPFFLSFPNDVHGCALVTSLPFLPPEILLFFHPCPLLHNISISSRLCVSLSNRLSFSSHLRMLL